MREQTLLQKAKQNPLLDAAARVAAWPVLAAQYRQAQRQADARRAGAHDPRYEWIRSQRGRFAGQRCFVVATGPSLTMEDLDRIEELANYWNYYYSLRKDTLYDYIYGKDLDAEFDKIIDN